MLNLLDCTSVNNTSRRGWVIFQVDPATDVQVPVCQYVPLTAAALSAPDLTATDKIALALLTRHEERQRRWRRVETNGQWRGPSCVEIAGSVMDERAFRRSRQHLAHAGIISIVPHPTSVRTPDAYVLHHEHALLQGEVVTLPVALLERADAGVALFVAYVAWLHGDRGPSVGHDRSLAELGRALGISRSRAHELRRSATDAGYLAVLPSVGETSGLALLDGGWWSRPGALIPGRAPAPVQDPPVTRPGSAGHPSRIRRSL